MQCGKCDTYPCECEDFEKRLDSVPIVYKKCRTCMKHYSRCKCEAPEWFASENGKESNIPLPQ